jgi:hypothetical protein
MPFARLLLCLLTIGVEYNLSNTPTLVTIGICEIKVSSMYAV